MAIIRNRDYNNIPIIICKTCGKIARKKHVIELEDLALIKEQRKTWNALIKSSFNIYYDGQRKKRNRRIFYSALLQQCINKHHKLCVHHLNGIKFHQSYLDTIKGDPNDDE